MSLIDPNKIKQTFPKINFAFLSNFIYKSSRLRPNPEKVNKKIMNWSIDKAYN